MSLFDKAKDLAGKNQDKVKEGLDKVGDKIDGATDGKYSDQIDAAKRKAGEHLSDGKDDGQGDGDSDNQKGQQPGGRG